MYPRVKVRAQEEPETIQKDDSASYIVRVIESLSLESHSSRILVSNHASKVKNGSHPLHARISKPRPKDPLTPSIAAPKAKDNCRSSEDNKTKNKGFGKDSKCQSNSYPQNARNSQSHPKNSLAPSTAPSKGKNNDGVDENNKINIRASSVPRPRAVLSSPDNDGIIGSQNQLIREKPTPLRRSTLKTDGITSQKNLCLREKRTLYMGQTLSPKSEPLTKLSLSKLERPHSAGKVSDNSSSVAKGKRPSELPALRQRQSSKVG